MIEIDCRTERPLRIEARQGAGAGNAEREANEGQAKEEGRIAA